jgi:predicted small lipoprotein YifL
LICSGISEFQGLTCLLTRELRQVFKEFALAFGVHPLLSVEAVVEATGSSGHPQLLQGFLKVHNDLAAIGKAEGDHAAHPLVVDIGIGGIVDAVAGSLHSIQGGFSVIQVFVVGHYNAIMINTLGILGALRLHIRALAVASLVGAGLLMVGCGQKGPLYLPTHTGAQAKPAKPANDKEEEIKDQPAR